MKKLLCVLLMLCMLFATVSCGKKPDKEQPTGDPQEPGSQEPVETEEPYWLDTLPGNDYGEDEFVIMTIAGNQPLEANSYKSVVAKALFGRDVSLQDHYGIEIRYDTTVKNDDSAVATMRIAASNDGNAYHAFIGNVQRLMTLASEGLLEDLNAVENLHMEKTWWNQSINRDCSIRDTLYVSAGPYSEYYYHAAFCMAYNKTMADAFHMENLYDVVIAGDWTLDKMYTLCTAAGLNTEDGSRRAISSFQAGMYGLFAGAGGKFCVTDENGRPKVELDSEHAQQIIEKINKVFNKNTRFYDSVYNNFKESAKLFTDAQSLFLYTSTGYINDYLPSSQIDYGIIPLPKYDSEQKDYITCAWPASNYCVGVPIGKNAVQKAFAGLMLEAYCFLSYEQVRPVKYESVLKFQVFRDPRASELMDMIFDALYFDLNLAYDFGGSRTLVSDTIRKNELDQYTSSYNGKINDIQKDIDQLMSPGGNH